MEAVELEAMRNELEAYATAVRSGAITPQPDDEEHFRRKFGYPAMADKTREAWGRQLGVRAPITLKDAKVAVQKAKPGGEPAPEEGDTEQPQEEEQEATAS